MFANVKPALTRVLGNPQTLRAVVVLTTLLIAALVGGAPHDHSGGG